MKNGFENVAVAIVLFLVLAIIALIVQYNLIDEGTSTSMSYVLTEEKTVSKAEKSQKYLQTLEGYEDKDVNISRLNDENNNRVIVHTEKVDSAITAVESVVDEVEEEVKRKDREDKLGNAIDDVLNSI